MFGVCIMIYTVNILSDIKIPPKCTVPLLHQFRQLRLRFWPLALPRTVMW